MYSTRGRPRQVTDAQVAALLEWKRTHKTLAQLARELGMTARTASYVLKRNGEYKQPSPELREAAQSERRRRLKRLAAAGWM